MILCVQLQWVMLELAQINMYQCTPWKMKTYHYAQSTCWLTPNGGNHQTETDILQTGSLPCLYRTHQQVKVCTSLIVRADKGAIPQHKARRCSGATAEWCNHGQVTSCVDNGYPQLRYCSQCINEWVRHAPIAFTPLVSGECSLYVSLRYRRITRHAPRKMQLTRDHAWTNCHWTSVQWMSENGINSRFWILDIGF